MERLLQDLEFARAGKRLCLPCSLAQGPTLHSGLALVWGMHTWNEGTLQNLVSPTFSPGGKRGLIFTFPSFVL